MSKTFKHIKTGLLFLPAMLLLASNVSAQSIIFSSDQWPKRWERAMKEHAMNSTVAPPRQQRMAYRSANNANGFKKVVQQGGWGKQPEKMRHKHERSLTPEYHNGSHHRYDEDPLKRRYALPDTQYGLYGYGAYHHGYYGSAVPVIPHLPAAVYPGMYPGVYPGIYNGIYPGFGLPGSYTAPGIYPFGGYPGIGYPW